MPQDARFADTMDLAAAVGPQLHRLLRQRVIRAELVPGARISETEIAVQYGVSRQPVREAFIKLSDEGLVEVRPQRGTYVRKINIAAVTDARFVREAIEADVVRLLAEAPDPALERELKAQLSRQREVAHSAPRTFVPLDDLFHRTLAEAAGKSYAWTVIEGMKSQMDRVRQLGAERFPMEKMIDHHARIAATIAAGDVAAAEAAMRLHLRAILDDLPVIRQSLPDYFEPADPDVRA